MRFSTMIYAGNIPKLLGNILHDTYSNINFKIILVKCILLTISWKLSLAL